MEDEKQTKLCKYCQTEIPQKAKVCPNCRKRQGGKLKWIIIIVVVLIISMALSEDEDTKTSNNVNQEESNQKETKQDNKKEKSKKKKTKKQEEQQEKEEEEYNFENELGIFSEGEYLYITNSDLDKYCENMENVKIYTVITVDDIKKNVIQSNLSEKYMMSDFNVEDKYEDYKEQIQKDDVVAILGTVSGYKKYSFMGKSVEIDNCLVFAKGKEAKKYRNSSSDSGLESYFKETEDEKDKQEEIEIEYIPVNMDELRDLLSKNPLKAAQTYEDQYLEVTGKINVIDSSGKYISIVGTGDFEILGMQCRIKTDEQKEIVSNMEIGQQVVVRGKCTSVGEVMGYFLDIDSIS